MNCKHAVFKGIAQVSLSLCPGIKNGSVHSAALSTEKYNIHAKQKAVSKIHHLTQTLAS